MYVLKLATDAIYYRWESNLMKRTLGSSGGGGQFYNCLFLDLLLDVVALNCASLSELELHFQSFVSPSYSWPQEKFA